MTTALITGGSSGLGLEFATQLAAQGHDLVLVARDGTRLTAAADRLRTAYGIQVETIEADLSDRAALDRVAERVRAGERPIEILVNNAGYGLRKPLVANPIEVDEAMFDVLCRAVLVLSHAAAEAMTPRGHGRIINVSSVAGYLPGGSYSAAKSYVTLVTEALAGQLSGTGVLATALCPGFTRTEFQQRAGVRTGGLPRFAWLDAQNVVAAGLADSAKGRVVSVPSGRYKAVVALLRFTPRSLLRPRRGVATR